MQPLVSEFLDTLQSKKYAPNSIHSHRLDLSRFLRWLEIDEEGSDSQKLLVMLRKLNRQEIESYLWDFGDGQTAEGPQATHLLSLIHI